MFYSEIGIKKIKKQINGKKIKKVFVIAGKKSFYSSGSDKIIRNLIRSTKIKVFLKNSKFPEINELKKILFNIRKFNPDLILAIGGGSVLDYGKISSVYFNTKNIKEKILKSNFTSSKKIPLLAIPTTAGSGAEVTSNAVIYIKKIKYSIENKVLKPNFYLLVPHIIQKLKMEIKSHSSFDAFAQSIESLLSRRSNSKSISYAKKSLKILGKNFISYIRKPNKNNSYQMCLAANYSGRAINISKTTAPHALSYPFTSYYGISHGHAVSLTINEFLKFNYLNIHLADSKLDLKKRYNILFKSTNTKNIDELLRYVSKLKKIAKLETDFKKLKIRLNNSLNKILSGVNLQRLSNNPVKLNKYDIKVLLKSKFYSK